MLEHQSSLFVVVRPSIIITAHVTKSFHLGSLPFNIPLYSIKCGYNFHFQLFLIFARAKNVVHFITKLYLFISTNKRGRGIGERISTEQHNDGRKVSNRNDSPTIIILPLEGIAQLTMDFCLLMKPSKYPGWNGGMSPPPSLVRSYADW